MKLLVMTLIVFSLSGCFTPRGPPLDTEPPEGWPVTLLATSTSMSHSGAGGVTAVPDWNFTRPATCVLFRAAVAHEEDTCSVEPGDAGHVAAPWHVSASFGGSGYPLDDPRRWSEKTIEVYDGASFVVAFWDGAKDYHRRLSSAIE